MYLEKKKESQRMQATSGKEEEKITVLNQETKSSLGIQIDQMIKENARKLLIEQRKKRDEEVNKKKNKTAEKDKIFQEGQKVREHNKIFLRPTKKKENKDGFAWGVDQRKFLMNSSRKANDEPNSPKKEKYYKLDDKERRERLGLGHLDENTLEYLRKRSKSKQKFGHEKEDDLHSIGQERARKLSREEEHQIKVFMIEKRHKLEDEQNQKRVIEELKKKKIKENLMRLREDAKGQKQTTGVKAQNNPKNRKKKYFNLKREEFGDSNAMNNASDALKELKIKGYLDYNYIQDLNADDENYENLYNEFKKIINDKQSLSTKHRNEEATKSPDGLASSERSSFRNFNESLNERRASGGSESVSNPSNTQEMQQRKQLAKQKMIQLSKRYENVLQGNEGKLMSDLIMEQQHSQQKLLQQHKKTELAYDINHENKKNLQFQSNHHAHILSKSQKEKPSVPAIQLPRNPDKIHVEQPIIQELETSNLSADNYQKSGGVSVTNQVAPKYPQNRQWNEEAVESGKYSPSKGYQKFRDNVAHLPQSSSSKFEFEPQERSFTSSDHPPGYSEGYDSHPRNSEYTQSQGPDEEDELLQNIEIIEAAAIFIQKNFRGYRTRKYLRALIEQICDDEENYEEEINQHEQLHGYQELGAGEYMEYPYEDDEGRRIIVGQNGQLWVIDRDGNILENQEMENIDEVEEKYENLHQAKQQNPVNRRSQSLGEFHVDDIQNEFNSEGNNLEKEAASSQTNSSDPKKSSHIKDNQNIGPQLKIPSEQIQSAKVTAGATEESNRNGPNRPLDDFRGSTSERTTKIKKDENSEKENTNEELAEIEVHVRNKLLEENSSLSESDLGRGRKSDRQKPTNSKDQLVLSGGRAASPDYDNERIDTNEFLSGLNTDNEHIEIPGSISSNQQSGAAHIENNLLRDTTFKREHKLMEPHNSEAHTQIDKNISSVGGSEQIQTSYKTSAIDSSNLNKEPIELKKSSERSPDKLMKDAAVQMSDEEESNFKNFSFPPNVNNFVRNYNNFSANRH